MIIQTEPDKEASDSNQSWVKVVVVIDDDDDDDDDDEGGGGGGGSGF